MNIWDQYLYPQPYQMQMPMRQPQQQGMNPSQGFGIASKFYPQLQQGLWGNVAGGAGAGAGTGTAGISGTAAGGPVLGATSAGGAGGAGAGAGAGLMAAAPFAAPLLPLMAGYLDQKSKGNEQGYWDSFRKMFSGMDLGHSFRRIFGGD